MNNQKSLVVQYPPQYGVITSELDDNNHFENTLFPSVYDGCWQSVEDIIRHNGENAKNEHSSNSWKEIAINPQIVSEPFVNPIIAITGSRGSGKSSAMYSFAKYLKTLKNHPCAFSILPPIDATQFGKNESVIGNITASMYREYSSNNADLSVDKKRDFVRLVKEVNNTAVMYSTGEWFKCGDDLLQDSEKVGNLRKRLHDLIINYLNLRSSNSLDTNKYLVIMLDDLDMCSEGAYSIIEEIRKFLCMRNVIILMTMQSTQLRTVLQAAYATAFGQVDDETKPKIRSISMELAFRSYEKLFPVSRCHAMPVWSADRIKDCDLFIEEIDEESNNPAKKTETRTQNYDPYDSLPEYTRSKILYRSLHMIWRKTLLIPVCSKDGEHLLIPSNLRSLHNFIAMFNGMKDVFCINTSQLPDLIPGLENFEEAFKDNFPISDLTERSKDTNNDNKPQVSIDTNLLDQNLTIFENYLLDNLSTYGESLNHNKDNQELAETLQNLILEMHTMPLERLNAKIVGDILESNLPEHIKDAFNNIKCPVDKEVIKKGGELYYLKQAVSYADCISIGDVLYVLGKISVKTRCRYIAYLVEVIRTMWSIRMTREFFIHSTLKEGSLKVSNVFEKTVGGLIVDANTTAFFKKEIFNNNDWYLFRPEKEFFHSLFFATSIASVTTEKSIPVDTNLAKSCIGYRNHNQGGNPYYKQDGFDVSVCHYLAFYTNALRDSQIATIFFPFYSLDFMYRFYEEFHRSCREAKITASSEESVFKLLDGCKKAAMGKVLKSIDQYIPINSNANNRQCSSKAKILNHLINKTENKYKDTSDGLYSATELYRDIEFLENLVSIFQDPIPDQSSSTSTGGASDPRFNPNDHNSISKMICELHELIKVRDATQLELNKLPLPQSSEEASPNYSSKKLDLDNTLIQIEEKKQSIRVSYNEFRYQALMIK